MGRHVTPLLKKSDQDPANLSILSQLFERLVAQQPCVLLIDLKKYMAILQQELAQEENTPSAVTVDINITQQNLTLK